jgi:hypothetical protein
MSQDQRQNPFTRTHLCTQRCRPTRSHRSADNQPRYETGHRRGFPAENRALGLLGDKAELSGAAADWPGYLALLAQAAGVAGFLIYGMTTIWLFGREFSDHTAKDLLALPTSRTAIVSAKFTLAATWTMLLALQVALLGLRSVRFSSRSNAWATALRPRAAESVRYRLQVASFGPPMP